MPYLEHCPTTTGWLPFDILRLVGKLCLTLLGSPDRQKNHLVDRTAFEVCGKKDEFLLHDLELLLGSTGFEQSPGDSGYGGLKHR